MVSSYVDSLLSNLIATVECVIMHKCAHPTRRIKIKEEALGKNNCLIPFVCRYFLLLQIHTPSEDICCGCIPADTHETFVEMMNFGLLKDPIFIIFIVSNFCTSVGFNVPYVHLAAQAEELGLTAQDGSYLVAIIGIANTFGRIILGYLSDKPWVNRLWVYNVCLSCCGIGKIMKIANTHTLC